MVTVSIADVIEAFMVKGRVIALLDTSGKRVLPIWVGEPEAAAIVRTLRNVSTPRPLTAEFGANLLKASGTTVDRVHISTLKAETFYATVTLSTGTASSEVDARPSDALALAVLMSAPITVDDAILANHGVDVTETQVAMLGRGLDALGTKLASEMLTMMPPQPVDDAERTYRELQALLTKH